MIESVTDRGIQVGWYPIESEFSRHWGREYLPYARFDLPSILPELDKPGIPLPTAAFVERYLQSDRHRISDLLAHELLPDAEGRQVMSPLVRAADGSIQPIVEMMPIEIFTEHFGFQPTSEFIEQQKVYFQVDAMIAGGTNALIAGRINSAIDCLEQAENSMGARQLADIFGLHRSADIYKRDRDTLRSLTEIDLKDRKIAIERLWEYMDKDPVTVYVYLINEIGHMMHSGIDNLTSDEVNWYRHVASLFTKANIGRIQEESSDTYLLPAINDAISFLKDAVLYKDRPHVFAVVAASLDHKFPIAMAMRYNALYITEFFKKSLTRARLVTQNMLLNGQARLYANLKPVNAAAVETAKDTQLQTQIRDVAKSLVINASNETEWNGLSKDEKARETLQLFEQIVGSGLERTLSIGLQNRIKEVTQNFSTKTFELYDNVRCRLHFDSPDDLDNAVVQARERIKGVSWILGAQKRFGKRLELYLRKSVYLGGSKRERTELRGKKFPVHPGRDIIQSVMNLTEGQLAYLAIHAHLPVQMGTAELHTGVRRKNISSVEVQMTLSSLAPMLNALERAYKTDPPRLDVLDGAYISKLRLEAQRALSEFI